MEVGDKDTTWACERCGCIIHREWDSLKGQRHREKDGCLRALSSRIYALARRVDELEEREAARGRKR